MEILQPWQAGYESLNQSLSHWVAPRVLCTVDPQNFEKIRLSSDSEIITEYNDADA